MTEQATSRGMYEISIASEFLSQDGLRKLTGQDFRGFANVIMKELVDNAIDACEAAKVDPRIGIRILRDSQILRIEVTDNAIGIPPEVVRRMLNFETRVSDKSVWNAPTRGQQGNGIKTVFGIPHALGGSDPVVIESRGVRHVIRLWKDAINDVQLDYDDSNSSDVVEGTRFTVCIRDRVDGLWQHFDEVRWVRAFAIANPHVFVHFHSANKHAHSQAVEFEIVPKVPLSSFKKWGSETTSAHWYTYTSMRDLIAATISAEKRGGPRFTLNMFVRQFDGLKRTQEAKKVCDVFPTIKYIADFEDKMYLTDDLLHAMVTATTEVQPKRLGKVGKNAIRERIDEWYGIQENSFWHKEVSGVVSGVPYVVEIAVAETKTRGSFHHAVNFSPTFEDFLSGQFIPHDGTSYYGIDGLLQALKSHPRKTKTAVFIHLICPVLKWSEYGKTTLTLPKEVIAQVAAAVHDATKPLLRKRKREESGRPAGVESISSASSKLTQKEAVFLTIPEAMDKASGGGQYMVSARTLFYQVRPLIQKFTTEELDYNYFSQSLLTQYQAELGALAGLYYDPRGVLIEPHKGAEIQLGTREVEEYKFPQYRYNKLLYIEKKGLVPILKAARIAERFDIAIIAGEGYANEATRRLLDSAEKGREYQIYVLHDADPDGYAIAATLSEETARMPDHRVDVRDLGLRVTDAIKLGIEPEHFIRRKDLNAKVKATLEPIEIEYFTGVPLDSKSFRGRRIELNALTAPQLVDLIERKLSENGVHGKVIPTDEDLSVLSEDTLRGEVATWAQHAIIQLLDMGTIEQVLLNVIQQRVDMSNSRELIKREFDRDIAQSWDSALARQFSKMIGTMSGDLMTILVEEMRKRLND